LVFIVIVVGGAAMFTYSGGTKLSEERTGIAKTRLAPPPAPTDVAGDRLPAGAVARLGTTRFLHAASPTEIAYAADGATLASFDGDLHLWDPVTGRERRRIETGAGRGSGFVPFAYAPNGQSLAVQGNFRTSLTNLYDSKSGREIRRFDGKGTANCLAFSPDGKVLAGGLHDDGKPLITLWEVASGRVIRNINSLTTTLSLAFLSDGKVLISSATESGGERTRPRRGTQQPPQSEESSIQFWDVATGKEIKRIRMEKTRIKQAVLAPNGKTLATAATDKTIRLWDLSTGQELRRFEGGGGDPGHITFSPDGLKLASSERFDSPNFWEDTPLTTPIHVWETATCVGP
jgi:WD40 repeat protein